MPVPKKPLRKLKAQDDKNMSPSAKVGTWLEKNDGSAAEAYDSSSSSDAEGSVDGRATPLVNGNGSGATKSAGAVEESSDEDETVDDEEAAGRREIDVDWDSIGTKIRPALVDKSRKRRQAFISRYLYVSQQCTLAFIYEQKGN